MLKKNSIVICILVFTCIGCITMKSRYHSEYKLLDTMYRSGQMSAYEYFKARQSLRREERQAYKDTMDRIAQNQRESNARAQRTYNPYHKINNRQQQQLNLPKQQQKDAYTPPTVFKLPPAPESLPYKVEEIKPLKPTGTILDPIHVEIDE
ncbi:MAG: hypothetical protein KKC39_01000 [Candidatus Omnitrophica bacterium]|nr:hypothetical protein [Candidatus Omnitrophota bacterium]MCG2707430.1 hypothetical protein [Candidatus Omnitrophota bacterium]